MQGAGTARQPVARGAGDQHGDGRLQAEYAAVVRAAMLALTQKAFNLNGVQATTHMAAPLLVVNGPIAQPRSA